MTGFGSQNTVMESAKAAWAASKTITKVNAIDSHWSGQRQRACEIVGARRRVRSPVMLNCKSVPFLTKTCN